MKNKKILVIMLACSVVALGFGFFVMRSRTSPLPEKQADNTQATTTPTPQPEPVTPVEETTVSTVGWKTYANDKHGFSVDYPTQLKAGSISDNSVLGTFQVPVRGYHVGPLVLVVLKDADIKKDAKTMFDGVYNSAKNPVPAEGSEVAPVECKIVLDTADKKAVTCNGEGGAAKYGYITGPAYDVFVDGYTKGYDTQENGNLKDDKEFIGVMQSLTFTIRSAPTSSTPTPSPTTPTSSTPPATPTIQTFNINADDSAATPSEISVTKGNIVQITFNVGTNTYYGGLDFKSSVVNSGTINAGQSKTISFKANESFEFTPYWPASSVAKSYKIKVSVL